MAPRHNVSAAGSAVASTFAPDSAFGIPSNLSLLFATVEQPGSGSSAFDSAESTSSYIFVTPTRATFFYESTLVSASDEPAAYGVTPC